MDFAVTGVKREDYLDIIEFVLDSHGVEFLESQLAMPNEEFHIIGFRISVLLAYVLEAGRRQELFPLWEKITEKCVRTLKESYRNPQNDLQLEELCISLLMMRDKVQPEWIEVIRNVDPHKHFCFMSRENMNNMTVYGAVGMYLREKITGESCAEHLDYVMPWILEHLDGNGMFDDYDHALLYDLTSRIRLEQLLWFGYEGPWAEKIENALIKGANASLRMQSAAFQIPYGGRSNQYLFNEALQISLGEFAAVRCMKKQDAKLAGQYKRSAHLSMQSFHRYLNCPGGAKHIRNFFPQDSVFGIDSYGTFPQYMITLATFIACGYLAADDTIEECVCPAELGGYAFITEKNFGKVFAAVKGQSIEYSLTGDPDHDAAGLGRYHAKDVPAELALSMPFCEAPGYFLSRSCIPLDQLGPNSIDERFLPLVKDRIPARALCISPGYMDEAGKRHILCETQVPECVRFTEITNERVSFETDWECMSEKITLTESGLYISCRMKDSVSGNAFWAIPILHDNGAGETKKEISNNQIRIELENGIYTVESTEGLSLTEEIVANRNGIYRVAYAGALDGVCRVCLRLERCFGIDPCHMNES